MSAQEKPVRSEQEKILVVVDPNDNDHIALQRAMISTRLLRTTPPRIHVLVAIDHDSSSAPAANDSVYRHSPWFETEIRQPLETLGLDYQIEVCWSPHWQRAIVETAQRFAADVIFLPVHPQPRNRLFRFSESKWELLKTASCPVILVRPEVENHSAQRRTVLAAVNYQADNDQQRQLNHTILERSQWIAAGYGAQLHLVNAYHDSLSYPDRGLLTRDSGLPAKQIHVLPGYTDEVVASVSNAIKADVLVLGTLGTNGHSSTLRGNTAERVISRVDIDVVVVNSNL